MALEPEDQWLVRRLVEAQKKQNDMNELAETNMKQSIEVGMSLVRPKKSVIDRQADFAGFSSDAPNQK